MTQHGIPKPQYYAMCMLSRIQGKLLLRQENCIATLTAAGIIQILFFHYVHLDQMYSSMDTSGVLPRRRNTCFEPADDLSVACTLKCPSGSYRLVKELLSTEQGSAFDAWVRLGADEVLNDREISYLKQICVPKMSTEQIQVQDSITLHLTLKPHEVAFWELTPRSPLDSDPVQSP